MRVRMAHGLATQMQGKVTRLDVVVRRVHVLVDVTQSNVGIPK